MTSRLTTALMVFVFVLAGCSNSSDPSPNAAGEGAVPDKLALTDITEDVATSAQSIQPLDDICRQLYPDAELRPDVVVGLVADVASINDGTFNQAAFEGMQGAGRCLGVKTTFLESAGNDAGEQIESLLSQEVDIVITVGFQFQEATTAAAAVQPDVRFIGVDQVNADGLDNYVAISFRDDQVGYLAGVAAAALTKTGIVAVAAGPDTVPPVVAIADGFEAGVRSVDANITALRVHLDSFSDRPAGSTQGQAFVQEGADVVFGAAGPTGSAAITTAAALGAHVIGVDQDQYFTVFGGGAEPNAEKLVTSAIKRVDLGVFLTVLAMTNGNLAGGDLLLGADTGGVTYAPPHEADLPPEVSEALEQARLDLAGGLLDAETSD